MATVLLDTSILAALLTTSKTKAAVRTAIRMKIGGQSPVVASVSVQEFAVRRLQLLGGTRAGVLGELAEIVDVVPFDGAAAARAAEIQVLAGRANVKPWFRDAAIAACAEAAEASAILTTNGKDFLPMAPFLTARVVVVPL